VLAHCGKCRLLKVWEITRYGYSFFSRRDRSDRQASAYRRRADDADLPALVLTSPQDRIYVRGE